MIEVYLCAFVNYKQNNWAKLLLIIEFAYNNSRNASTGYISFKLNCGYYPQIFFKDKCNTYSKSFSSNKLATKLKKLMNICC